MATPPPAVTLPTPLPTPSGPPPATPSVTKVPAERSMQDFAKAFVVMAGAMEQMAQTVSLALLKSPPSQSPSSTDTSTSTTPEKTPSPFTPLPLFPAPAQQVPTVMATTLPSPMHGSSNDLRSGPYGTWHRSAGQNSNTHTFWEHDYTSSSSSTGGGGMWRRRWWCVDCGKFHTDE